MKKIILGIAVLAVIAVAAVNVNLSATQKSDMSLLALANVEALADIELPEVTITCSTDGSGDCYFISVEEGLYGQCRFDCEASGDPNDHCSSCWVNFANYCSAFAAGCGG